MIARKLRTLILTIGVLMPSLAIAGPITAGTWTTAGAPHYDNSSFWDGLSADCSVCGVGNLLQSYGPMEFLHIDGSNNAIGFKFDDATINWDLLFNITAWMNGTLTYNNGVFFYDSHTGQTSNSLTSPEQYVLFRQVGPQLTTYYLGVEDILLNNPLIRSDRDYNDYVVMFTSPTQNTPEPSTLLLVGTAMAGAAIKRRYKARRAGVGVVV